MGINSEDSKTSVPRFTSFRPKPIEQRSGLDDEQPTKKRTISRSPSPPRISSTDRKSNLKEQKSIRRHHESSLRSRQHVESTQHRHKRRADSPKRGVEIVVHEEAPKPYFVDVEGDKGNVSYGSLHRYAVPFYRRLGAGSILGRPSYEKIDRNVSLPGFITLADRDASSAVRDKGLLARALPRAARETHVRPTDLKTVHPGSDYLSLQDSDAPSKSLEEDRNDDSSVDEAIVEYRSIDGKAKAINQPDDPDLVYGSIPSSGDKKPPAHDAEEALRKKGMRILQRVDQQPDNINTWMELIQHQDELLVDSNDIFDKGITHAQRLSTTDMKLSMYEKALASVNDRSAQERLLLGLMDEGMKIWDTEKTIARWQAILLEKSTHPGLWVEYLNFRQSSFTTFRYEEVRQIYVECLSKLREAHQSQAGKHLYQMQLYVVLRLTTLMKEAGYVENAIAIWQAILEFSIRGFQSPETGQLNDDNISILQSFWDSEVLRIGEDGAIGLAQFAVSGGEAPQPLNGSSSAEMSDNICIEKWAMLEWERAMHSRMPARTLDEVGEDDPYRVILFSDLQDFILDPPQHKDHVLLATAFLSFCGLPPLPDSEYRERSNSWDEDPFIRSGVLHEQVTEKTSGPLRNTDDPFTIPTKSCVISTECLFSQSAPWYVCFDEWMATSTNDGGDLQRSFVRLALKTIVNDRSSSDDKLGMAEYFLGFENCAFPRTVKKNGKGLLKDHPSSMKLWNAYALCELGAGKRSNAETVIVTNINSKGSIAAGAVGDAIVLWKSWLWEILGAGEPQKTLKCLLLLPQREVQPCLDNSSTASNTQPEASPSSLLRTERILTDGRDHMLSTQSYILAATYTEVLLLFAYLRTTPSPCLEAALSTFTANFKIFSTCLPPDSPTLELLHQHRARLLHYHVTHTSSFKPSLIRSVLTESITLYPHNTIFLSLYTWNEARFRIDDRVRSIMRDVVLAKKSSSSTTTNEPNQQQKQDSITSHFFAIHTELNRGVTLGSNTHAIRATFERAVTSSCGSHNISLWKAYFHFEHDEGRRRVQGKTATATTTSNSKNPKERRGSKTLKHGENVGIGSAMERAKNIFYRAIRACPWSKALYMLAFQYLVEDMETRELRGIWETMTEKGIRVHISLDEVFEKMDE